jgi:hypothetical protein
VRIVEILKVLTRWGLRSLRLQDQEGRSWLSEDKKWSQRFELSGLELLFGQPRKAVNSKQDRKFSYTLLWYHFPTSSKLKSSQAEKSSLADPTKNRKARNSRTPQVRLAMERTTSR